jgi:hypothetical protein
MQLVKVLPSKIVQIDGPNALCEDGSVWTYVETGRQWAEVHPPHEPPTQSEEFKEALHWLEVLWRNTYSHEVLCSISAFMRKHGSCKQ